MNIEVPILAIVYIVILGADAIACAIPIDYIKNDLERLNCSESTQKLIPKLKFAALAGLIIGLWVPVLGLITAAAMVAYFIAAISVHAREKDAPAGYIPAILFLVFSAAVGLISYLPGV